MTSRLQPKPEKEEPSDALRDTGDNLAPASITSDFASAKTDNVKNEEEDKVRQAVDLRCLPILTFFSTK